jgi:hypothetical protein
LKSSFLFTIVQSDFGGQNALAEGIVHIKWSWKMYDRDDDYEELRRHYMGIGLAIGMPIGMAFSLLFVIVLEMPGLIGVGGGMGVALGISIGEGLYQRKVRK